MPHLDDKLVEFFYAELSPAEMETARQHIEQCADCRLRVEQFSKVHIALRAMPDADPPRHIVFSPPERRAWIKWLDWRSALAGSAVAALLAGVVIGFSARPQSEHEWVANELVKRDQEIQRLQGELVYYENMQRAVVRQTFENGSAIQLLAQRTDLRR